MLFYSILHLCLRLWLSPNYCLSFDISFNTDCSSCLLPQPALPVTVISISQVLSSVLNEKKCLICYSHWWYTQLQRGKIMSSSYECWIHEIHLSEPCSEAQSITAMITGTWWSTTFNRTEESNTLFDPAQSTKSDWQTKTYCRVQLQEVISNSPTQMSIALG